MMETLFRGKRMDNNEWVEGWLVAIPTDKDWADSQCYIVTEIDFRDTIYDIHRYAYEVFPDTVGQYAGIMIDDERIFEDDIIRLYSSDDFRFVVQLGLYDKTVGFAGFHGVGFYCECVGNEDFILPLGTLWTSDMEKMGNIHDNPELLE